MAETTEPSHKVFNNTFSSEINLSIPVGGFILDPIIHENPPNEFEILGEDCPCNLGSGIGLASVFPEMEVQGSNVSAVCAPGLNTFKGDCSGSSQMIIPVLGSTHQKTTEALMLISFGRETVDDTIKRYPKINALLEMDDPLDLVSGSGVVFASHKTEDQGFSDGMKVDLGFTPNSDGNHVSIRSTDFDNEHVHAPSSYVCKGTSKSMKR